MITGIGTPISQSRSPRPIAASFITSSIQTQKGVSGSAVAGDEAVVLYADGRAEIPVF